MDALFEFVRAHENIVAWVTVFSLATFILSLVAIPFFIIHIPTNYFSARRPPAMPWRFRSVFLRTLMKGVKNAVGIVFILGGIVLLVLPGQGLLSILIGILLLDFPGKRALELKLVRRPRVLGTLNWVREKGNREPLKAPARTERS